MFKINLHDAGIAKFILCEDEEGKRILQSDARIAYHEYILEEVHKDSENKEYKCKGGGYLNINHTRKKIRAYGTSVRYGMASKQIVEELLTSIMGFEEWIGYELEVKMSNNPRD